MDKNHIIQWVTDTVGQLNPPGCVTDIAPLPANDRGCCKIAIVQEHRFAFYYWGLHKISAKHKIPALVTIDSHDDTGAPNEVIADDLNSLDLKNQIELALYTWLRLRSLNDGHILPALYLNFFSDVYVLLNRKEDHDERQQKDYKDRIHKIKFYQHSELLIEDIPPDTPVFFDIDLDYFAIKNPNAGSVIGSERLRSDDEIRSTLSIDGPLVGPLLNKIVGLTIALEPKYCGGLMNSLHVLNILNSEFFNGTLCTNSCDWKKRAAV